MGTIIQTINNVQFRYIHNDVPIEHVVDDDLEWDIFLIESVEVEELSSLNTWLIEIEPEDAADKIEFVIQPGETVVNNLPVPRRFPSEPLVVKVSIP